MNENNPFVNGCVWVSLSTYILYGICNAYFLLILILYHRFFSIYFNRCYEGYEHSPYREEGGPRKGVRDEDEGREKGVGSDPSKGTPSVYSV